VATDPKQPETFELTKQARTKPYWFVGAHWGDDGDQSARFIDENIWINGYSEESSTFAQVNEIEPGDQIAIKSAHTQKNNLPFSSNGQTVSVMSVKAVGTVTKNHNDGRHIDVQWSHFETPKKWFLYTNRVTIWKVYPDSWVTEALIEFAFNNKNQDFELFRNDPRWEKNFSENHLDPEQTTPALEPYSHTSQSMETYSLETLQADGCFLSSDTLKAILNTLQHKKNLILQGPPGTGKSWLAKRLAWALSGRKESEEVRAVQFHPNLSYEDFVRGWRPSGNGQLELIDGPFLQLVQQAHQQPERAHIMVVEEINRGNPAQIFGELLTLLENSKRSPQDALELSYGEGESRMLYLPKNIYLIGTMNIADRSLALVDLALRRRFAFINLTPQFNTRWQQWLRSRHNFSDTLISQLQQRIESLNQLISDSPGLGEQYQIGHSYLTPCDPCIQGEAGWAWFREVIDYELYPLLEEYWFDQPQQARDQRSALLTDLPGSHR